MAGVLLATDVGAALDALSPEAYGAVGEMGARSSLSLANTLLAATPTGDAWTYQLGYNESKSTATNSPTTLNATQQFNASYVLATRGVGQSGKFSVLLANDHGNAEASGFIAKMTGQSVGLAFGANLGSASLDVGFTSGDEKVSGVRSGQSFTNASMATSTAIVRLTLAPVSGFSPFVSLSHSAGKFNGVSEVGTGANLNVASFDTNLDLAEIGANYSFQLTPMLSLDATAAYGYNLASNVNAITSSFADATSPTSFTVNYYGAGLNQFRGGVNLKAKISEQSYAGLSYEMRAGSGVTSASEVKLNLTCRF